MLTQKQSRHHATGPRGDLFQETNIISDLQYLQHCNCCEQETEESLDIGVCLVPRHLRHRERRFRGNLFGALTYISYCTASHARQSMCVFPDSTEPHLMFGVGAKGRAGVTSPATVWRTSLPRLMAYKHHVTPPAPKQQRWIYSSKGTRG